MPKDECRPISKVYPADVDQSMIICIDSAYTQYLGELDKCNGNQACCAKAKNNYKSTWSQCTGTEYPD